MISTLVLLATFPAPVERTMDFHREPPILEDGKLTKRGRKAILSGLRRASPKEDVTLVVCVGDEQALSSQAGMWLARMLASEAEKHTGQPLAWVVREDAKDKCPNSVLLTFASPPARGRMVARVLSSTAEVSAELADGRSLALFADSIVPAGTTLKVRGGSCQLMLLDGSHLSLGDNTEMTFNRVSPSRKRRNVALRLLVGEVWARVTELVSGADSRWVVETRNAIAGVRGTEFVVSAVEQGGEPAERVTHVDVFDGTVSLTRKGGRDVMLETGQRGTVTGAGDVEVSELLAAPQELRPVSGEHDSPVTFRWQATVADVTAYRVQIAQDVQFNRIVVDRETTEPFLEIDLKAGWYYWRVLGRSSAGRRSYPSQLFKIYVD